MITARFVPEGLVSVFATSQLMKLPNADKPTPFAHAINDILRASAASL